MQRGVAIAAGLRHRRALDRTGATLSRTNCSAGGGARRSYRRFEELERGRRCCEATAAGTTFGAYSDQPAWRAATTTTTLVVATAVASVCRKAKATRTPGAIGRAWRTRDTG